MNDKEYESTIAQQRARIIELESKILDMQLKYEIPLLIGQIANAADVSEYHRFSMFLREIKKAWEQAYKIPAQNPVRVAPPLQIDHLIFPQVPMRLQLKGLLYVNPYSTNLKKN
jgi:hypothetical protein